MHSGAAVAEVVFHWTLRARILPMPCVHERRKRLTARKETRDDARLLLCVLFLGSC